MSGTLWRTFVEDAAGRAARLRDGLAAGAPAEALAHEAYGLATAALLMGVEDVGRLALACDEALSRAAGTGLDAESLATLRRAAEALAAAVAALAAPDASGARADPGPLRAALAALEASGSRSKAAAPPPSGSPPISPSAEAGPPAGDKGQSGEGRWIPLVDDDMMDLFLEEAHERLEGLAEKLLRLEGRPDDADLVREIFRDLHTVKGSSGMVGLAPMNRLAHAAEDLVAQLRDGARRADRAAIDALLSALDRLREILGRASRREPVDVETDDVVARLREPDGAVDSGAGRDLRADDRLAPAPAGDGAAPSRPSGGKQTLRVDFDKLDLLMNLVGELVLGKAGLAASLGGLASLGRALEAERRIAKKALAARRADADALARETLRAVADELGRMERVFAEVAQDLTAASERLNHVSADLRDEVMKLRMVPIGGIFRKHLRTVRDLAGRLGKKVRLELEGEETELDKILVEQIEDPLLHLVRNAVDHGVEPPEVRLAAGKPAEGTVRLCAYHRGNQIVIEISDDGGGIDPEKLRHKARATGIASDEELAHLDDRQVLDLVFRPGFSTAARVTDVSGRGVGMDVVKETIVTRLKGTVSIASEVGRGTTITLKLPLTLAIIQVLLLRAGGETFAVPLDVVRRTLVCGASEVRRIADREVLAVRDRQVPLVRVRDALELEGPDDRSGTEIPVILCEVWGKEYGLACERLLGKQEIVIKTLGDLLEEVPCAAGATLLGDRCAIILDVPALVARALHGGGRRVAAPDPAFAPRAADAGAIPDPTRPPRILLVEDSDVARESLRRLLTGAGYEVVEARDGAEGLELARAQTFDLISTDVMMPHLDGYELTRALRASERHRDTPIVMVTSRGERIDRVRGFDAGVDEYITKPHDRQELLQAVARLLGRRAAGNPVETPATGTPAVGGAAAATGVARPDAENGDE